MTPLRYVVAGSRAWSRQAFDETISGFPGEWRFVASPAELEPKMLATFGPRYIFFLHWSWVVPASIHERYECVVFHMTDVPYGRGGSPLQNLIMRGFRRTKLTALRMEERMDSGPVYSKVDLSLEGSAEEIYRRAASLSAGMILSMIEQEPKPEPQRGQPTVFKRRTPPESEIPPGLPLERLHDFIRMLDADGYPRAFLEKDGFRYEFRRSALREQLLEAEVRITRAAGSS